MGVCIVRGYVCRQETHKRLSLCLCLSLLVQVKRRLQIKHTLHMSAKDEAIKKASEKTAADPKKAHKWIKKEQLAAKKEKAKVKKLADHKKAAHKPSSSHETKSQKLIKWYVFSAVSSCPRPLRLGRVGCWFGAFPDAGVVLWQ